MIKTIGRVRLFFLALFAVLCAIMLGYQMLYVWPAQKCAEQGKWFAPRYRACATIIDTRSYAAIYGRMNRAEAAETGAAARAAQSPAKAQAPAAKAPPAAH